MKSLMGDGKKEAEMVLCDISEFPELRIPIPHNEEAKLPPCGDFLRSRNLDHWVLPPRLLF